MSFPSTIGRLFPFQQFVRFGKSNTAGPMDDGLAGQLPTLDIDRDVVLAQSALFATPSTPESARTHRSAAPASPTVPLSVERGAALDGNPSFH
jgi:hypothetical protein